MESSRQLSTITHTTQAEFHHHMSYAELSCSLAVVCGQGRVLSKRELRCLELSQQDPFLKKMLELYPLSKQSQNLVTDSLDRQWAEAPETAVQIDTNFLRAIPVESREITAGYLQQNYPTTGHANVIDKVEAFLRQMLKKRDPQNELEIAERERYAFRQTSHAAGDLRTLTPRRSLEQIAEDFNAYVEHLRALHQGGYPYDCWAPLSSIFHRLESLAENSAERAEAELLLLRAFDDNRTVYHDRSHSYVAAIGYYTCHIALAERLLNDLLDHHSLLVPVGAHPLGRVILTLTEPFILRDGGKGRPSFSQAFYQFYMNAAGYQVEEGEQVYFELSSGADKAKLKEQYLGTIVENRLEKIRAGNGFDGFMRLMQDIPCDELEGDYRYLLDFLSAQEGMLERVKKTCTHFRSPEIILEHETVIAKMLAHGPFIDRAHLEMVLALHDEKASLASMEQAAFSGTPGTGAVFQQSTQEMCQAYQEYLATQEAPFYHFMNEQGLQARFEIPDFHTIGCSQTVLCQWLREAQSQLPAASAQKLAVLCAKGGGYASAIKLLCEREDVSADYVDRQERRSLLWMAVDNNHAETVRALLAAEADVNLPNSYGETALMHAAINGNTDIVRALLAAGANVKLQDNSGRTALMVAAAKGCTETVRALLAAGAEVNLQDRYGETALMHAAINGNTDIVRALIEAGVNVKLQDKTGRTTLMVVAGHTDIFGALIEAGATAREQDIPQATMLMGASLTGRQDLLEALMSGNIEIIRTIIADGANVNRLSDGQSALDVAMQSGDLTMVREVLASDRLAPWVIIKALKRCVENNESQAEMLPLLLAHADMVQLIIRNGHQKAALAWAAEHQCVAAVQAFIAAGAPLNEKNDNHETALMIAQRLGNEDLIALLSLRQSSEENNTLPATTSLIISSGCRKPAGRQGGREERRKSPSG